MKKLGLFIVALLLGAAVTFGLYNYGVVDKKSDNIKVMVLDLNKVMASLPQVKTMQENLKNTFDPRGKKLVELQKDFMGDLNKYREKNSSLAGDNLKKEQEKIIAENKKLREARVSLQRDLVTAQNEALAPILKQLELVVNQIAKEQGIGVIIAKTSTAYNDSRYDITDQVIAKMKAFPAK